MIASFVYLLISTVGLAAATPAEDACQALNQPFFYYYVNANQPSPTFENCVRAYEAVKNKDAFVYAMSYFTNNIRRLADDTCAKKDSRNWYKRGIQNQCSFVFADFKDTWPGSTTRATGNFIDLCAKGTVLKKFYVNRGTGNGYRDKGGANTTVPGAFLTNSRITEFTPYNFSGAYKELKRKLGGTLPELQVIGLHSTNNDTDESKHIHVSPYQTSWGCPSVNGDNVPIMKELAKNGPSLWINYISPSLNPLESVSNCSAIAETSSGSDAGRGKASKKKGSRRKGARKKSGRRSGSQSGSRGVR